MGRLVPDLSDAYSQFTSFDSINSLDLSFPKRRGKNETPSVDGIDSPAISSIVGARSIFTTTSLSSLFDSTPGPRTKSGTLISEMLSRLFNLEVLKYA